MKKVFLFILAVLLMFSACSDENIPEAETESSSESSASEEEKQPEEDFEHNPISNTMGREDAVIYDAKGNGAVISFGNGKKADIPIESDQPGIPGAWWYASQKITAIIHAEDISKAAVDIITTDDCGEVWHEYMCLIEPGEIAQIAVHFYDKDNGFFAVNYADGRGILYRVYNKGAVVETVGEVGIVYSMTFVDENHGFLVRGEDWVGISKTSDGGKTWTDFEFVPPEFEHKEIACYDRPIIRGDYGEVMVTVYLEGKTPWVEYKYTTDNFGKSWEISE